MTDPDAELLAPLAGAHDMLLSTRKRDGSWVSTPVNPIVEDDHVFFRTWRQSGKAKRLRNTGEVRLAPSTARGRVTGDSLGGHAELLDGDESRRVAGLIQRRFPVLQGLLVPLFHRLRRLDTQHYVVTDLHRM